MLLTMPLSLVWPVATHTSSELKLLTMLVTLAGLIFDLLPLVSLHLLLQLGLPRLLLLLAIKLHYIGFTMQKMVLKRHMQSLNFILVTSLRRTQSKIINLKMMNLQIVSGSFRLPHIVREHRLNGGFELQASLKSMVIGQFKELLIFMLQQRFN